MAQKRRRNRADTIFTGDPSLWPQDVRDKFARAQAEEREVRERLRRQYEVELEALDRKSLSRALKRAAAAGKPDPWRWVRAKIREGELRAWGTIGSREDQPIDPVWLDHEKIFKDDNGNPKPPDDDCLWFERSVVATSRVSSIAVDSDTLAMLLGAVPALRGEPDDRPPIVEASIAPIDDPADPSATANPRSTPDKPYIASPTVVPPLSGKALVAALDDWAKAEWGPEFGGLPGWEDLLRLAKDEFPDCHIIRDHARDLRAKYATTKAKHGGAPMHRTTHNR